MSGMQTRAGSFSRRAAVRSAVLVRALGWSLALGASAAAAFGGALDVDVRNALAAARLGDCAVGVCLIDAATGDTLAGLNAERDFIPASNMKVLTSGAALAILGPDFAFRTELALNGPTAIVRGAGDPAFADPELLQEMNLSVENLLDAWVKSLKDAGAIGLTELVLDTRVFDDEWVHPTWPADQLNRWYCAEVHGINFHANVLSVFATPMQPGVSPKVRTQPSAPWLTLENQAKSVSAGANTLWVSRAADSNRLRLFGDVRWATEKPVEVALHDMPSVFGRLLADRIAAAGLGQPRIRRAAQHEDTSGGQVVAVIRTQMDVILRRCNTDSHNLYAEALIKRLGHEITDQPGTWGTGAAAVRMAVQERLGPSRAASLVIADGSGMSRGNQVSPALVAEWLAAVGSEATISGPLLASLPVGGEDGTLRRRFADTPLNHEVRAKSGYLNGVSCLSGYVLDSDTGRKVAFSVLVNDVPASMPVKRVKDFHEQIAKIADRWLSHVVAAAGAE